MKKEKSAKAPVKAPVKAKKPKTEKAYDIITGKMTTIKKPKKEKPNFSTEKFVNLEDGKPLKKPVATLYVEVIQTKEDTCEITIKGMGEKKIMVDALSKAMIKSDGYFELFMEAAALAMIERAESAAKNTKTTSASTKKKFVTKKASTKKK